jgi:hypothetical protein
VTKGREKQKRRGSHEEWIHREAAGEVEGLNDLEERKPINSVY